MSDLKRDGAFDEIETAPKDGTLVIGRDAAGEMFLMRWRSQERILAEDGPDDQKAPYWALWHADTPARPVQWAPTRLEMNEVLDWA